MEGEGWSDGVFGPEGEEALVVFYYALLWVN